MQSHRPSILHRPQRTEVSQATKTTSDAQFEREQAYWQQKQQKSAETQDRLLRSIYTTEADKAANAAAQQEYLHVHMQAKMMEKEMRESRDKPFAEAQPAVHVYALAEDRPWLNPSMIYQNAAEERNARRKYEEVVAEENRRLAAEKVLIQRQLEQQENARVRSSLAQEEGWWNVGAQGGKYAYALPERRRPTQYEDGASALPTPTGAASKPTPVWAWSGGDAAQPRGSIAAPAAAAAAAAAYNHAPAPYAQPMSDRAPVPALAAPFAQARPSTASRAPWATDDTAPEAPVWHHTSRQPRPSTASRAAAPWATEEDLPAKQQQPWRPQQAQQNRQFPWSMQQ